MLPILAVLLSAVAAVPAQVPDSLPPSRILEAARLRTSDVARLRAEALRRDAATEANLAQFGVQLRAASAELDRTTASVAQSRTTQERIDALAEVAPSLLTRVRRTEERLLATSRAQSVRAADRVVLIERGLEALRLKAQALHRTAVAFNAGFDLGALASPASFREFDSAVGRLRGLTAERQRSALDLVIGWLKDGVPGVSIVGSMAGVVVNAFSGPTDNRRSAELKQAGDRLLCIAAVSQAAMDRLGGVRASSSRLEQLSLEVEERAAQSGVGMREAVGYRTGESFESFVRRTHGDLAVDEARQGLPFTRLEPAMLGVAAAARLEYDLSRSSADLSTQLGLALYDPPVIPACTAETQELVGRYAQLHGAVRELQESLAALASADDGIAVFVPPLPGR
ncbi:MAG: hypothetical protein SGI84_09010 [Gemmatimonadota bacterium]|nr:hypothetical protein [Gemmatimonadota bacterium]